jgi:hypothetical protein
VNRRGTIVIHPFEDEEEIDFNFINGSMPLDTTVENWSQVR